MILCCRIPDIPIAALVLKHAAGDDATAGGAGPGELSHGRPIIVGGYPSERRPVRSASPEARSFGVVAGMPLRQAEQLCPEALFFPVDEKAEADLARHLLAGLYALAPRVELGGGVAYVELDGLGDPMAFALRVGDYLHRRLHSRPALGIGAGKFVAATAASLVAAQAATGAGAVPRAVPRGSERSFLAPLPIADHLPIGAELVARLKRFGLRRIGDLAAMPLASVEAQFGAEGLTALRLARGEDSSPLLAWSPPQRMEEASHLDPPVDNLTPLLFVARGLIDRLGTRLVEGGYAATVVRMRLEEEGVPEAPEAVIRLRLPMSSGEELWTPVSGLIQRQSIRGPVGRIHIRLTGFCPAGSRQMDLLARQDGRLEDVTRQLGLLADVHGSHLVRMPELPPAPPLVDEQRYRWTDPVEGLMRQAGVGRGRRRKPAA